MSSLFLETPRLLLKFPTSDDLPLLLKLRSNPEVMRYIGDGRIHTFDDIKRFLKIAISYQERYGHGFCCVFEKISGQFIGQAGLFHLGFDETQNDIEIAYRLLPEYWRKGYATELAKALVHWGFTHLSVQKLIAATHLDNIASQNVLKKAGFILLGKRQWYTGQEVMWFEVYKNDAIELVPYDSAWPMLAAQEITRLQQVLPAQHILDIQHIGSTAIPGLLAKPIIDIQIAVDSLVAIKKHAIEQLKKLNYVYWDENPDLTRLFFVRGMPPFGEKREVHVHIVEPGSTHWQDKLQFRDYLLMHPETRLAYAQLKQQLEVEHPYDREQYTQRKTAFIQEVLIKARQTEEEYLSRQTITPYQDINDLLSFISGALQNILGENLIGLYLFGSLSYGNFNPNSSDIDLVVIVHNSLNQPELKSIKQFHRQLKKYDTKWGERTECSYTPIDMLKSSFPPKEPRPYYGGGIFYDVAPYGNEWIINNYLLYQYGISLIGPDFKKLTQPIEIVEVQKACIRDLFQEWEAKIDDIKWLDNSHYQSYLILNLCRILYTVFCGIVGTKREAAEWVKNEFGEPWLNLIEAAQRWEYGTKMVFRNEAIEFIKFSIDKIKENKLYSLV